MQRFCKVCRGWHSLDEPWPHNCRSEPNWNRADLPAPRLIRDGLDDVWNPVNGKIYDSKSSYYRAVKDAGCEIAGSDSSITEAHQRAVETKTPSGLKDDLKRAWDAHS